MPFPFEAEGRAVVRGPLEFDGQIEVDLLGRWGGGEEGGFHVGPDGEPPVVVCHEFREVRIRGVDGRYPPQPKLGYQPRLKRPPKPLYPSLRLGDGGGDELDPELPAHAFEVDVDVAVDRLALLGELPELEYRPVVPVEGLRDPVFVEDLPHHLIVALEGFLLVEEKPHHHGSRCVVYGPVEGGFGKRIAEPVMDGGVDLEQLPEVLPPWPGGMLGLLLPRFVPLRRSEAGGGEDSVEGLVGDGDPLFLVQLLQKMPEIEALVFPFVQSDHRRFGFGVRPPRLRLPFVSVGKARRPLFGIGLLEPVHVLLADPEFGRGLPCFQSPRNRLFDHRFDIRVVESIHGSILRPNDGTGDN